MTDLTITFKNEDVFYAKLDFLKKNEIDQNNNNNNNDNNNNDNNNKISSDLFDDEFTHMLDLFDSTGELSREYQKTNDKIFFFDAFMQLMLSDIDEFFELNLYSLNKKIGQKIKIDVTEQSVYDFKYLIKTSNNFLILTNNK